MHRTAVRRAWYAVLLPQRRCVLGHVTRVTGYWRCLSGRTFREVGRHSVAAKTITGRQPHLRREHASFAGPEDSTIYALSTAPGRAAIAIIRISGPECLHIYRSLCPWRGIPNPRYATLRTLYQPNKTPGLDSILDSDALILYFPAPRTVTGEDVLEFHIHGGAAIVKAVLAAISECHSPSQRIRYAEPGEFTRRAFMNDRLDLTQVEALGDVLSATTEQQRKVSVRGTGNSLAKTYERWRQQLLYARGELEALIDFSEDQHFDESPAELCASVSAQVRILQHMLAAHVQNAMKGELLRHGISMALLGAPNAGKSSLLNYIVGREAAIVSHEEGTTRDVVEVGIDLGGFFCRLGDTAGLRRSDLSESDVVQTPHKISMIEKEGMRRSKERAAESDVVIVVLSFENRNGTIGIQMDPEVISTASQLVKAKNNILVVINKSDLISNTPTTHSIDEAISTTIAALPGLTRDRIHLISCKNATKKHATHPTLAPTPGPDAGNFQAFLQSLVQYFHSLTTATTGPETSADPSELQDSLGASERHRLLLLHCAKDLEAFQVSVAAADPRTDLPDSDVDDLELGADMVVAAEHLRSAADCLAKITGKGQAGDVEEVLGVVFEKFCVGK